MSNLDTHEMLSPWASCSERMTLSAAPSNEVQPFNLVEELQAEVRSATKVIALTGPMPISKVESRIRS